MTGTVSGSTWFFSRRRATLLGMCGLLRRETLRDVDVGFALIPAYWRKGYASEAASAVIEYGRDVFGLKRIVAITSPDNVASSGVLDKVGLKFEAVIHLEGDEKDVRLFASEVL